MQWNRCCKVALILSRHWKSDILHRHQPSSISPSFASLRFFGSDDISSGEPSEEDLDRWERMYEAGKGSLENPSSSTDTSTKLQSKSQIRVISFDLDNTIWKTSASIDAANDALASFLDERNITQTKRVEKVMGDLFAANKAKYCPVDTENSKSPVLLTLLRKDAIQFVLEQENGYSSSDAIALADEAFDLWLRARHDAIENHLVETAVETLNLVSGIPSSAGFKVKIGAITDGNSNPDLVECLSGFFDFVVNAEQVGVSKPDKRIYLQAAREVLSDTQLLDLLNVPVERRVDIGGGGSNAGDALTLSYDAIEDILGPWWVHVGDDFVKDIVAAKSLNMRSIWVKELVQEKVQNVTAASISTSSMAKQRTVEDLVKEVAQMKEVEMEVGAEDFLAQSLQSEFADAVVDRFADLSQVIRTWHEEAAIMQVSSPASPTMIGAEVLDAGPAVTRSAADVVQSDRGNDSSKSTTSHKFCIFCGQKIAVQARFCSSCGKAQE
ncbi:hypothetical protein ACA910_010824 [Epithemia clementina (nom. ined.)]